MKIILEKNNGKRVAEREVPENTTIYDIICRNETIAAKIWVREDVANQLEAAGFEPSDQNIDAVINTGYLKKLDDCTDVDWIIIDYAISYAKDCGNIK